MSGNFDDKVLDLLFSVELVLVMTPDNRLLRPLAQLGALQVNPNARGLILNCNFHKYKQSCKKALIKEMMTNHQMTHKLSKGQLNVCPSYTTASPRDIITRYRTIEVFAYNTNLTYLYNIYTQGL